MAYGTVKVDNITFDQGGVDQNVTVSGIYRAVTSGVTVSGTISGAVIIGGTSVSGTTVQGTTVTGTTVQGVSGTFTSLTGITTTGTTANFASGVFTTRVSGATITGTTAQFTSGTFISVTGTTITGTTINGTTVNSTTGTFTSLTGTTFTGVTVQGTTVVATTGNFTSLTGITTTGTTARFTSGVFTTQVSGLTVTGTQSSFTSGNFINLSGTTVQGSTGSFTSGVFASGTAALPSVSFVSDPNTGIYSPGADQVAISTNGTGRLFVDSIGNVGINGESPTARLYVRGTTALGGIRVEDSNTSLASPAIEVIGKRSDGNNSPAFAGKLLLSRNRTDAAISTNTNLGALAFGGNHTDGTFANILYSASIVGRADGAFNSSTDMPTALVFLTGSTGRAPDTAGVDIGTERMRLDSTGRLGLGTSSPSDLLDIRGNSNPQIRVAETNNSTSAGLFIENQGQRNWQIWADRATDTFRIGNNSRGATNLAITSTGAVGIGTTSPVQQLDVHGTGRFLNQGAASSLEVGSGTTTSQNAFIDLTGDTTYTDYGLRIIRGSAGANAVSQIQHRGTGNLVVQTQEAADIVFSTTSAERARIDSSGRLLVGTSTDLGSVAGFGGDAQAIIAARSISSITCVSNGNNAFGANLLLAKSRGGTTTIVQNGDTLGSIRFGGADGTNLDTTGAAILAAVDGTPGADDMPGRLVFSTTADGASSPTERMRIDSAGQVMIGTTVGDGTSGVVFIPTTANRTVVRSGTSVTTSAQHYQFFNPNGAVGSISTSASATAYTTSSDYRLKENVVPLTNAIDRLQQIPVHRFNFIADPDTVVDGFIAHEAQEVVPECVIGTKDEVDDDGNPVYQGIDQSKLVPLLTAALQEAIAEIASLKDRVAALEAV